jgi:hypothetical protein
MTSGTGTCFDPEIERLLCICKTVQSFIQRTGTLLDAGAFPKSSRTAALLAKEFEAEFEVNLLRAYDRAEI